MICPLSSRQVKYQNDRWYFYTHLHELFIPEKWHVEIRVIFILKIGQMIRPKTVSYLVDGYTPINNLWDRPERKNR